MTKICCCCCEHDISTQMHVFCMNKECTDIVLCLKCFSSGIISTHIFVSPLLLALFQLCNLPSPLQGWSLSHIYEPMSTALEQWSGKPLTIAEPSPSAKAQPQVMLTTIITPPGLFYSSRTGARKKKRLSWIASIKTVPGCILTNFILRPMSYHLPYPYPQGLGNWKDVAMDIWTPLKVYKMLMLTTLPVPSWLRVPGEDNVSS